MLFACSEYCVCKVFELLSQSALEPSSLLHNPSAARIGTRLAILRYGRALVARRPQHERYQPDEDELSPKQHVCVLFVGDGPVGPTAKGSHCGGAPSKSLLRVLRQVPSLLLVRVSEHLTTKVSHVARALQLLTPR